MTIRKHFSSLAAAAVCTSLLMAVPSSGTAAGGTGVVDRPDESAPADEAVEWQTCVASVAFECASVTVPWDHADPLGGSLDIPIVRLAAAGPASRLGTIVFNPGGPGIPGTGLLMSLIDVFPAPLRERFDIVSFDPRGTGGAQRVDCGTDASALLALDQTAGPESVAANAWAKMAEACRATLADRLGLVSTAATAKDLDLIRQALGEETIDWYGASYGTRLGVEYLRQFPDRVRSMVLDGAMDPSAPLDQMVRDSAMAAEAGLERLLGACAYQDPCPLGADPVGAYDTLAERMASEPLTSSDGHTVGLAALQIAAQTAVALPDFQGRAFVEALAADGSQQADRLLAVGSSTDITGQSTFDAFWTILCNDEPVHPDATAIARLARELSASTPRVGLGVVASFGAGCQAWPAPPEPLMPTNIATDVPVLIVGSTGDPITAYGWSQHMAGAITGAHLLTREGDGHTAFYSTFLAGCAGAAIADFFVDLQAARLPQSCSD